MHYHTLCAHASVLSIILAAYKSCAQNTARPKKFVSQLNSHLIAIQLNRRYPNTPLAVHVCLPDPATQGRCDLDTALPRPRVLNKKTTKQLPLSVTLHQQDQSQRTPPDALMHGQHIPGDCNTGQARGEERRQKNS